MRDRYKTVAAAATSCLFNYSPGPAVLPLEVHRQIRNDLEDESAVLPLLEMGHRRLEFCDIAERAENTLRALLDIPDNYHILFLAGGASAQYAMVPMNLSKGEGRFDYFNTGHWSLRALDEARRYGQVHVVTELMQDSNGIWDLPVQSQWQFSQNADYCHFVDNETLTGFELPVDFINTEAPIISDMTSNFLTRRFDLRRFGIIYAGTQKNAGIAGLAIVIVRDDLLRRGRDDTPSLQNYTVQVKAQSRCNTPPIFSWYVCGLVLEWTQRQGGIDAMEELSARKSALVYQYIDNSTLYKNSVASRCRSRLNVHFQLTVPQLEYRFVEQAERQGLVGLRGHRAVGGIRASLYNAMPMAGAETLVSFMRDFERNA